MQHEPSIEQVIKAYTPTVYGVALTHTARRADADDVFQEVFTAYWRSKPQVSSEEHRKAWLIRTTLNFSLKTTQSSWAKKTVYVDGESVHTDDCRAASEYQAVDAHSGAGEYHGSSEHPVVLGSFQEWVVPDFTFQSEQQTALYTAMSTLQVAYRTVVLLFYFEDLSIAQISAILDEEQGTIKTRLSRARAQLRKKLEEGARDD